MDRHCGKSDNPILNHSDKKSESNFVNHHDVRVLNTVIRSIQRQESLTDTSGSCSLTDQQGESTEQSRLQAFDGSMCESVVSYDAQLLHELLAQSESGQVLGNFWTHSLQPHAPAPSLPPATSQELTKNNLSKDDNIVNTKYLAPPPSEVQVVGLSSAILTSAHLSTLTASLPMQLLLSKLRLLYSIADHGADILSFYKLTKGATHSLLVVQTDGGEVFGGFAAEPWQQKVDYYGSGESFVFRVSPSPTPGTAAAQSSSALESKQVEVFPWTYENNFFMLSNKEQLAMGGGQDGFAFVLDADFISGSSRSSATFRNPPLTAGDSFRVLNLEVWGFESSLF